jgi:hypothetical protein
MLDVGEKARECIEGFSTERMLEGREKARGCKEG